LHIDAVTGRRPTETLDQWPGSQPPTQRAAIPVDREAVRLAVDGVATGVACEGCPPLRSLVERYAASGGKYLVCPICFDARSLDKGDLVSNAELGGTVPLWQWIGDDNVVTFSY
jgi:predicted peroxiredoxin